MIRTAFALLNEANGAVGTRYGKYADDRRANRAQWVCDVGHQASMTTIDPDRSRKSFSGPRSISDLVPTVAHHAFRRSAPGISQLLEAWPGIVGPALAVTTTPRRLAQGTLTIGCSGPMAMELQHLSAEVMQRINQYLGSQVVRRLRFLQTTAAAPFPLRHARTAHACRVLSRPSPRCPTGRYARRLHHLQPPFFQCEALPFSEVAYYVPPRRECLSPAGASKRFLRKLARAVRHS